MIPKILHCVWLGGKEMPPVYRAYAEAQKKLLPDWEFRVWNEDNFGYSDCEYAQEAYRRKKFGFVADYIRVCVLEQYGGVYLDTDVELLRKFPSFLTDADCFLGFENDAHAETAVIGCMPQHPLMKSLHDMYRTLLYVTGNKENRMPNTLYFTYFLVRDYQMKLWDSMQFLTGRSGESVILCPTEYFAPINFNTKKDSRTENTVAVHHFANSWSGTSEKIQQAIACGARRICGKRLFGHFTRIYVKHALKTIEKIQKNDP